MRFFRYTVLASAALSSGYAWNANAAPVDAQHYAWNSAMIHRPVPGSGCFTAHYPNLFWRQVRCTSTPANTTYLSRKAIHTDVVGNGNDWILDTCPNGAPCYPIQEATGFFIEVYDLEKEESGGVRNEYTLQLNTSFFITPACKFSSNPTCKGWEQFIFDNGGDGIHATLLIQVRLINYGTPCPTGWTADGDGSCYKNGHVVSLPRQNISNHSINNPLQYLILSGSVAADGNDTVILSGTTGMESVYSATIPDSDLKLAKIKRWTGVEFNIFGGSNGGEAEFNDTTQLGLGIQIDDAYQAFPVSCDMGGTTGETNNLILSTNCSASSGSSNGLPEMDFSEQGSAAP